MIVFIALALIDLFVFVYGIRWAVKKYKVKRKRAYMVNRVAFSCIVEDVHGASGCHVTVGERNVACLVAVEGRISRRYKPISKGKYREGIERMIEQPKDIALVFTEAALKLMHRWKTKPKLSSIKTNYIKTKIITMMEDGENVKKSF